MIELRKYIKNFEKNAGKLTDGKEKKERLRRGHKKMKNLESMVANLSVQTAIIDSTE
jgi:hypothetical protein